MDTLNPTPKAIIVPHRIIRSWYTGRCWVGTFGTARRRTGRAVAPPSPSTLPNQHLNFLIIIKPSCKAWSLHIDAVHLSARLFVSCLLHLLHSGSPVNPKIATLKPQSNRPSYSNTVTGTQAVDGWAKRLSNWRFIKCP